MPTIDQITKDFKFFSGPLKAFEVQKDGKRQMFVEGVASSTVQDRQGDQINRDAVVKMARSAQGITLFLNHSYNVPEDVFGSCTAVSLDPAMDSQQGACTDMRITVLVNEGNPRAVACWQSIMDGVRLAFSVGGALGEYILRDPKPGEEPGPWTYEGKVMEIQELKLYEISLVGIPANQRAYVEDALAKAIRKKLGDEHVDVNLIPKSTDPGLTEKEKAVVELNEELDTVLKDNQPSCACEWGKDEAENDIVTKANPACEIHKEAPPIESADLETPAVDLEKDADAEGGYHPLLKGAIIEAMHASAHGNLDSGECAPNMSKCMSTLTKCWGSGKSMSGGDCVKCMNLLAGVQGHGLTCGFPHPSVAKCYDLVKGLLPPGYEGDPADPMPSANNPTDEITVPGGVDDPMPHSLSIIDEELTAKRVEADKLLHKTLAQVSEAQAKADELTAIAETKAKEVSDLEAKLEKLKAMRLGRRTVSTVGTPKAVDTATPDAPVDKAALAEKRRASMNADSRSEIAKTMAQTADPVDDPRLRSDA